MSEEDDYVTTSGLKLPTFGEDTTYETWWLKITAYARVKGWAEALEPEFEKQLGTLDETVKLDLTKDEDVKKQRLLKQNRTAIAALTMSLKRQRDITKIFKTKVKDKWPSGKAHKVITLLKKRYQPDDILADTERQAQLEKISMKVTDHPDTLSEQISESNNAYFDRLGSLEPEKEIALILRKAPAVYADTLTAEKRMRKSELTPDDLYEAMSDKYRQVEVKQTTESKSETKMNSDDDEEAQEVLLAALTIVGEGKALDRSMLAKLQSSEKVMAAVSRMICFECGKQGHMAANCPDKQTGGGGNRSPRSTQRFNGKCHHCGMKGHKKAQCFHLESNAHRRPPGFVVKQFQAEQSHAMVDRNGAELLMAHVDAGAPDMWCKVCSKYKSAIKSAGVTCAEASLNPKHLTAAVSDVYRELALKSADRGARKNLAILQDPDIWIADTGATVHSTQHDKGMFDTVSTDETVTVGNGDVENTAKYGKIKGTFADKDGTKMLSATLDEVSHTPASCFNLFSVTRMLKQGWELGGNHSSIWIVKGGNKVIFDIKVDTSRGNLFCARFLRTAEMLHASTDAPQKRPIAVMHAQLGHCGEADARATAKALSIPLTRGSMKVCEACAKGKAKRKALPKATNHVKAEHPGERMFLDLSTIKKRKNGDAIYKPNWRMLVDERTELKHSDFYESKNGMVEPTCEYINQLVAKGYTVKYLRMDNAGENKLLESRMKSAQWKLAITPEYTARHTPQQNHLVELGFYTIANRARAMMAAARIPLKLRYKVARDCLKTATQLDGLMVITLSGTTATRYEHFSGTNPRFVKHLRIFGEAGVVTLKDRGTSKVANRGETCMFVGYAPQLLKTLIENH